MNAEQEQWLKELEENEKVQQYFQRFLPFSVESFKQSYLSEKSMWMQHGSYYTESMELDEVKWVYSAFEHLQTIQQKKLFDAQCLWRAEKLIIPEVEITADFMIWENDILNCPFIEPVAMDDVELYNMYLQEENKQDLNFFEHWQDYKEIKEAYNTDNGNRNFPDWYEFYNGRRGTGVLMNLPDIRGEKEEFYRDIHFRYEREKNAAKNEEWDRNRDKRPVLSNYAHMDFFVTNFENKESQALYKAYKWGSRNYNKEDDLRGDLDLLFSAEENVPIAAHDNWMEAIRKAAESYRAKKIIEAIPQAWEQYMLNIQTGIAFEPNGVSYKNLKEMIKEQILAGRVLNGEPKDLNFQFKDNNINCSI